MLRFNNVTYTYPFRNEPAVRNISFEVAPGELTLCTGASGCGKSTLLRLANGLCPQYYRGRMEGEVRIRNLPATRPPHELARDVGTLFQDPEQQFFALNVADELAFVHEWQGATPEAIMQKIHTASARFDLGNVLDTSILELSEGQKQKVGLASLLSQSPCVLVLDEPSANLDPESTAELAQTLRILKGEGLAVLVVDHRLYWLEDVADRVLVMREGEIRERGDFSLLRDAELRERYGLRACHVPDPRPTLPDCGERCAEEKRPPALTIRGLDFAWAHGKQVFSKKNITLPHGVVALIGENGVGKTTLARLLTGLSKAHAGTFQCDGVTLRPEELLQRAGIVLQNADHQLHMRTVAEEVELCLQLAGHGENRGERSLELLRGFALEDLRERHPQSLSGGEKQRLVITCALAKNPDLLILDEPTSGLDGLNMRRIADALERFTARGAAALVITHDLELMKLACRSALRLEKPFPRAAGAGAKSSPETVQH